MENQTERSNVVMPDATAIEAARQSACRHGNTGTGSWVSGRLWTFRLDRTWCETCGAPPRKGQS